MKHIKDALTFPSRAMQWLLPILLKDIDFHLTNNDLRKYRLEYTILGLFVFYTVFAVLRTIFCLFIIPHSTFGIVSAVYGFEIVLMAVVYKVQDIFSYTFSIFKKD